MNINTVVEFDEWGNRVLQKTAALMRLQYRLQITTSDIPYYFYGLDSALFELNPSTLDVKAALRDIDPNASVVITQEGRVTVAAASVTLDLKPAQS